MAEVRHTSLPIPTSSTSAASTCTATRSPPDSLPVGVRRWTLAWWSIWVAFCLGIQHWRMHVDPGNRRAGDV